MTDEEEFKKRFPKMYDALFGNPVIVNEQLQRASLFIMSYECLKDFITDQFNFFFSNQIAFTPDDQIIHPETEELKKVRDDHKIKYTSLLKKLGLPIPKRLSSFNAACAFFYEIDCLNEDDITQITRISKIRNDLAHNLIKFLLHDGIPKLEVRTVFLPVDIFIRASNSWIKNVEAGIDPEQYAKFSEEELNSAKSMQAELLSLLINRSLKEKG